MATISGGDKLARALEKIGRELKKRPTLAVGFLEGATYLDGTSVPLVAAINEYGRAAHTNADGKQISAQPPRPYFRNMIAAKSGGWPRAIMLNLKATNYNVDKTLAIVGEGIKGQLQESILTLTEPPLAPSTIRAKGFSKPLIDTSHMLNSVTYEVRD